MPRGSKPGERRGGRKKGVGNKAKANRTLAIQIAGVEPKAFLLQGLGFYQAQINAELAKGAKADQSKIAAALAAGKDFAKDAAPYCHSRLGSIEHSGRNGGPITTLDLTKVPDEQLSVLEAIFGPLAESGEDDGGHPGREEPTAH
jgi:hypothetical protein